MPRLPAVLVVTAVLLGLGMGLASGDEGPVPPKALGAAAMGDGAATSIDGGTFTPLRNGTEIALQFVRPTFVRGPARIRVGAGTIVWIPAGSIVQATWEPAVRGWHFRATKGGFSVQMPNATSPIPEGSSVTLTNLGDLYRAPNGYAPSGVLGLAGLPEVSGFRPYVDDRR